MAENNVRRSAGRRLVWLLVIILGLSGMMGWANLTNQENTGLAPKLALDLEGGTQIILSPSVAEGDSATEEQLQQAVSIIRQRIDASGVAEAQVATQGNQNIVVSIPGTPDPNTLQLIRASAKLEFRPVLTTSASVAADEVGGLDEDGQQLPDQPSVEPENASDPNWITPALQNDFDNLDCSQQFREPGQVDDPNLPLVTCDSSLTQKYILGPVEVEGANIADATSGTVTTSSGASTNEWAVNIEFDGQGTELFSQVTSRLFNLAEPRNQFAITLDGFIITAPRVNDVIPNGQAQITGSFTQDSSQTLADSLKYGALPIGFEVQSQENISATLGTESLNSGLIAGLIGLILVVVYMTFQYRGLAIVTLGSLVVAGILVYLVILYLAWRQGYRLSLAGVAGLIVAIGITSDSFIVYFERIRDEIRDGRALEVAVEAGWKRAFRTILVSDAVTLTAAIVLFWLTASSVRGFAFTLGLVTLIDLIIVLLFTHPLVQLLARTKFFRGGGPWSGFEVGKVAASYVGRGQFRVSEGLAKGKAEKVDKEATKRQTIAERKAQEIRERGES
ncbi:MAG: protein translocase subunit SecD [Microbacteriaceae bacterium]|nr:protein translocase subunit SecD [Microbacteriaceae bacterium]MDR9443502.1 protein translocase subunit SecD [Microbacteriaceae bacterium]